MTATENSTFLTNIVLTAWEEIWKQLINNTIHWLV